MFVVLCQCTSRGVRPGYLSWSPSQCFSPPHLRRDASQTRLSKQAHRVLLAHVVSHVGTCVCQKTAMLRASSVPVMANILWQAYIDDHCCQSAGDAKPGTCGQPIAWATSRNRSLFHTLLKAVLEFPWPASHQQYSWMHRDMRMPSYTCDKQSCILPHPVASVGQQHCSFDSALAIGPYTLEQNMSPQHCLSVIYMQEERCPGQHLVLVWIPAYVKAS